MTPFTISDAIKSYINSTFQRDLYVDLSEFQNKQ